MIKFKDVFVVDDDKIYHFILRNLLSKNDIGIKPSFFENGFDALEILKEKITDNNFPDLILLDINMPIMDGWQFLDEFKKLKSDFNFTTTIYLVTSSNDILDLNRAEVYKNEISNYFLKPINDADLCKIFLN
jgi:CheY-like chemotaxis protein